MKSDTSTTTWLVTTVYRSQLQNIVMLWVEVTEDTTGFHISLSVYDDTRLSSTPHTNGLIIETLCVN